MAGPLLSDFIMLMTVTPQGPGTRWLLSCHEEGVIEMMLNVYLCGWLVTTIGALVAANWLSDRRMSRPLSLGCSLSWPVREVADFRSTVPTW